jgi:hypothetical protein
MTMCQVKTACVSLTALTRQQLYTHKTLLNNKQLKA